MNGSALRQNIVSFGNPILVSDQNCGQQSNPYLSRQNLQNEYQIEEHLEVVEERVPGCCFISGLWRRDCNIFRVWQWWHISWLAYPQWLHIPWHLLPFVNLIVCLLIVVEMHSIGSPLNYSYCSLCWNMLSFASISRSQSQTQLNY